MVNYARIAINSLRTRKIRSWLTMLGIVIGISAIVALISLSQGLKTAVGVQFASLGTDKIIITPKSAFFGPPGVGTSINLTKKDLQTIEKTSGVKQAVGRLIKPAKFEVSGEKQPVFFFVASFPEDTGKIRLMEETLRIVPESGRLTRPGDKYKVVIGNNYAHQEVFGRNLKVGEKMKINGVDFEIIGVMAKTGNPQNEHAMIIQEDVMRDLFDVKDVYSVIVAQIDESLGINNVAENIAKNLRRERDVKEGQEDFSIQTPEDVLQTFGIVLTIIQAVLIGIAAISLLVGGVGIMNTMYTSVLERRKDIGIMKAVGAKNSQILALFMIESGILGLVGGTIGLVVGFAMSKTAEIAAGAALGSGLIQASFPLTLIIGSLAFSFIVGTGSGILPAIQASRMPPVEALRQ